jgi:hypothetical protein
MVTGMLLLVEISDLMLLTKRITISISILGSMHSCSSRQSRMAEQMILLLFNSAIFISSYQAIVDNNSYSRELT